MIKKLRMFLRRLREERAFRQWAQQNKTVTLNGIKLIRRYPLPPWAR